VLQLSSGCYNFCRFALLEPLQSSSSCCTPSQQPVRRSQAQQTHQPAQVLVDGFATDSAKPAADSNDNKAAGSVRNQADSQQQHQLAAAAAVEEGLLSQQFRQTAASQQQQQQQESLCQQVTDLSVHSQAATTTAAAAAEAPEPGEDLTEDAEEQLMLRNAAAPSSSNSEAATAFAAGEGAASGPCHLALPSDDAGNLGIWQLGAGASAAAGAGSSQRPQMLLAQRKGPDQPHRGQCMAVVLLQPQVRSAFYKCKSQLSSQCTQYQHCCQLLQGQMQAALQGSGGVPCHQGGGLLCRAPPFMR
jgi:hypothetical protein